MQAKGPPVLSPEELDAIRAEIRACMNGYFVVGGELVSVNAAEPVFRPEPKFIGAYPSRDRAYDAWKAASWSNVDNAHARYLILSRDEFITFANTYPHLKH